MLNKLILIFVLSAHSLLLLGQGICPTVEINNTPSVSCFEAADGSATAIVSGGSGNFSYSWSNGANTPSINFLPAGIYYVNILDNNTGCTVFDLAVINEPDQLTASLVVTDVLCFGGNSGAIDLTPQGGTPPYNYAWSNNANSQDLNGVAAGPYSVTVSDANGCSASFDAIVNQPNTALGATITGTNPACRGDFNGSVNLDVFGGTPPYDFSWNGGVYLTEDLENIPAGTYSVDIRDDNDCTVNRSVTISDPPVLTSSLSSTNVSCFGESDGSVDLTVNGGTPPYTYNWFNSTFDLSFSTQDLSGLPADEYTVEITDSRDCEATNSVLITEPTAPLSGSISKQNVSCFGDTDGEVSVTASGGTPPYSYNWSNNSQTPTISNLAAGLYFLTITDDQNCTYLDSVLIEEPSAALSLSLTVVNVSCAQGNDGAIDLTVNGGTSPYQYNWNSGTFNTEDLNNLFAGVYDIIVTDAKGCTANSSATVTEPSNLVVLDTITDVDCFGNTNGAIDLNVSGGTTPFTYQWSSSSFSLGNTSQDLSNLAADTYFLTLTDGNSCEYRDSFEVTQPTALTAAVQVTDVNCFGGSDGAIDLTVNGGVLPYTFSWVNSFGPLAATTEDLNNIPAETYEVTVTDFNNCTIQQTAIVNQPNAPLAISLSKTDVSCFGGNDGSIDLQITGGTPPYAISWSNGSSAQNQVNLFAGTYSVIVTDANGCQENGQITVSEPTAPLASGFQITDVLCNGQSNGSIITTITGGTTPYSFTWVNSDFALSETSRNLVDFPADEYILTTTDANECLLIDTVEISEPDALTLDLNDTDVLCFGDSTGNIDLTVTGGVSPYLYNWSNGSLSQDLQDLASGWFAVTVTDANNCTAIDSVFISQPAEALNFDKEITATTCFGGSDGRIIFQPFGGTAPYSYTWSNGDSTAIVSGVKSGSYSITITDANNCVRFDSVFVPQPDKISIVDSINPVRCYGENSGDIFLTVTGGTDPYRYRWSNSEFQLNVISRDIVNVPTETYTVEVRDSNDCIAEASFFLPEPDTLLPNKEIKPITCAGSADGGISLFPTGGNPGYSYSWSSGSTDSVLSNLDEDVYSYTITDTRGCEDIDTIDLPNPDTLRFNADVEPVSCIDQADGIIELSPSGGYGNYAFSWSTGESGNPLENLAGGEYTITITDFVGCSRDSSIILPVIDEECLFIPNSFTPNGDGRNDVWMIENLYLYPDCTVRIFNRWGNLVFDSKGYNDPWDGTKAGNALPSDTYYYVIDINNGTTPKSGSVTIVR